MAKRSRIEKRLHLEILEARQVLAANILVVTDPAGASQQPDDVALLNFLTAAGHTIDADSGAFTTGVPTPAQLADVDMILVSRVVTSGNYTQGTERVDWNALGKPMLVMSPHLARSTHFGFFNSTAIISNVASPTTYNAFPDANHPFVAGLTTSFAPAGVTIDSLNSTAVPAGATTVATITVSGGAHAAIVDIPSGAASFGGSGNFGERRVFFTVPEYPDVANQDFDDVLTANANQIVLNIIDELTETELEAEDATLSGPVVATQHAGFTGTGYVDFGAAAGQFVEWNVNVPQAGLFTLNFRYVNGSAGNRPLELRVNNNVDQTALAFNPTGAWTTWAVSSEQVTLTAGANTIRLTSLAGEGPNLDHLDLSFDGVVVDPPNGAPTNLTANSATSSQINLFWTDNATNETEYQVERRLASGGSFTLIATLPTDATSYINTTGLSPNTQYLYRVRAANSAGESAYSNEANATTLPRAAPPPQSPR